MPNITLAVPQELKKKMDQLQEINWSEVTRLFLKEKVKRALILKKLDKMLESSILTEKDCLHLGEKVKDAMWEKYKSEGW